jgi:hypothetical protein
MDTPAIAPAYSFFGDAPRDMVVLVIGRPASLKSGVLIAAALIRPCRCRADNRMLQ